MQRLSEKMQFPFFISPGIAEAMFMWDREKKVPFDCPCLVTFVPKSIKIDSCMLE